MTRIVDPGAGKAPIHIWARKIDDETERQLVRLASLPFVTGHVASMADAHLAEGVAVGTVKSRLSRGLESLRAIVDPTHV